MKYKSSHRKGSRCALLAVLGMTIIGTTPLWAADKTWVGTTSAWTTGSNWNASGVPASTDHAYFDNTALQTTINNGGTAFITRLIFSGSNSFTFGGGGAIQAGGDPMISHNGSGRITFNSNFAIPFANRKIDGSGSGAIFINGNISGAGSFAVAGSAKVYFNGIQTSTGTPTYSVSSAGSTLGGTGRFNSNVFANGGVHIDPGNPDTIGTLVLAGGFNTSNNVDSTYFDFTLGGAGNTYDQLSITGGTFGLRNPTGKYVLNISDMGLGATAGIFDLINWTGATESFVGTSDTSFAFGTLPVGWLVDTTYGTNGIDFDTTANTLSVKFTAVPEPGTLLLAGIGLTFLLVRLRTRRA